MPAGAALGPTTPLLCFHPLQGLEQQVNAELRGLSIKAQTQLLEDAAPATAAAAAAAGTAPAPTPDASSAAPGAAGGAPNAGPGAAAAGPAPAVPVGGAGLFGNGMQLVQSRILEPCDMSANVKLGPGGQDVSIDISDVQLRMSPDVMQLISHLNKVRGESDGEGEGREQVVWEVLGAACVCGVGVGGVGEGSRRLVLPCLPALLTRGCVTQPSD